MQTDNDVDTAGLLGRRELHFEKIEDALADVDVLAAAEANHHLRHLGNWSFGQILSHLATWADYSYTGVPLKTPLLIRWVFRPFKRLFLSKPMRAGSHIPKVPGGTLAIDPVPTEIGLAHFRRSFERLRTEAPPLPHMLFGPLTHAEWIKAHLRHAELHLSFLRAD